ncbi:hypothetical protein BDR26DRAFT_1006855 [Obelidium mucronatum]|nr:hypothetical protein BDR26DRAFT_1006855 [Obelidium mucronatum]
MTTLRNRLFSYISESASEGRSLEEIVRHSEFRGQTTAIKNHLKHLVTAKGTVSVVSVSGVDKYAACAIQLNQRAKQMMDVRSSSQSRAPAIGHKGWASEHLLSDTSENDFEQSERQAATRQEIRKRMQSLKRPSLPQTNNPNKRCRQQHLNESCDEEEESSTESTDDSSTDERLGEAGCDGVPDLPEGNDASEGALDDVENNEELLKQFPRQKLDPNRITLFVKKSQKNLEIVAVPLSKCTGVQLGYWMGLSCKSKQRIRVSKLFQKSSLEEKRIYLRLFFEMSASALEAGDDGAVLTPSSVLTAPANPTEEDFQVAEAKNNALEIWFRQETNKPPVSQVVKTPKRQGASKITDIATLDSFQKRRMASMAQRQGLGDTSLFSVDERTREEVEALTGMVTAFRQNGFRFSAAPVQEPNTATPSNGHNIGNNQPIYNTTVFNITTAVAHRQSAIRPVFQQSRPLNENAVHSTALEADDDNPIELQISGVTYAVEWKHLRPPTFHLELTGKSKPSLQELFQNWDSVTPEYKQRKVNWSFKSGVDRNSTEWDLSDDLVFVPLCLEKKLMSSCTDKRLHWSINKERNLTIWEDAIQFIKHEYSDWASFAASHPLKTPTIASVRSKVTETRKSTLPIAADHAVEKRLRQLTYKENSRRQEKAIANDSLDSYSAITWKDYCLERKPKLSSSNKPGKGGHKPKSFPTISQVWRTEFNWPSNGDLNSRQAYLKKRLDALDSRDRNHSSKGGTGEFETKDGLIQYTDGSVFWVNSEGSENEQIMIVPSYEAHNLTLADAANLSD